MQTTRLLDPSSSGRTATASRMDLDTERVNEQRSSVNWEARAVTLELEREREKRTVSGCQSDFSVRHPWLRNVFYFAPALGAMAGGIARAAIGQGAPWVNGGLIAFGVLWGVGSCIHLRADRRFAERYYEGDFRYC